MSCYSDLLRNEVKANTLVGTKVAACMASGQLVPDEVANEVVALYMRGDPVSKGFILDGYPRTVNQALYLEQNFPSTEEDKLLAVNITLEKWVAVRKLLARQICSTCGSGFNTAHIVSDGYDMPAILPDKKSCVLGEALCNPVMTARDDDTEKVLERRFEEYAAKTQPLLDFYSQRGALITFDVKEGVKDTDALLSLMKCKS